MTGTRSRILVALSGGVDSSVAAALLKEQGHAVEGAFIITWQAPWLPCTWPEERRDAMRVAAKLHIPFHTIDLSAVYERDVVQYLVREYAAGNTPNPDVMCNKYVKFGALFEWAMEHGFDYIATGHYARVVERTAHSIETGETTHTPSAVDTLAGSQYALLMGIDLNKDQTYFLWTLTQRQLKHALFPVGELKKSQVRELAQHYTLPTAQKKDSQGVCFLGKIDMTEFLQHYIPAVPGSVLDTHGSPIGTHQGAPFYTLGQRHGFTIYQHTPTAPPLYVVAKDIPANTITVAPKERVTATESIQDIHLSETHWISEIDHTVFDIRSTPLSARLRYRQQLFPVDVRKHNSQVLVHPHTPQPHIPKGQSLVLYRGDECIGGGIIA